MKLLLGATVALLLGALAVSWQGMKQGVADTSPDELERLKKQITELRREQDNLKMQRELQQLQAATPAPASPELNAADIAAMKAELEAGKAALQELEAEKAERDAKVEQDEEGLLAQRNLESGDTELRRARMIAEALLVAKVREYVEDPDYGGFATIDVMMPEQVQPGTILAIRRKTGILGQLKVSDVSAEGAIANPLPGFGPIEPQPGDELILPPQY
ncbi:MAG: hypothetical protein KDN05_21490 [Verrucomicrobiae bacterium]|nr:hypothetical protein [Verrucomicrobiae bacterium]MCP5533002.1 hypothetical protein [Akkermansiaceae bacterium]MCP5543600.1 hypothetical protein [Akkermansiaceae bacterium]MCP5547321.1 hypothetical protein [Akkermansiaceae bacterium]